MKKITIALTLFFLSANCLISMGCHSRKGESSDEPQPTSKDWFDKGVVHAEKGNQDQAIAAFTKALDMDSLYTSAYFYRGRIWEEKGELNRAASDYTKVIRLSPNLERAYNSRGNVWHRKGNLDRAIADYTKVIEINPEQVSAYHNRGNAWGKKEEYDRAIADFTKALELTPDEPAIYDNRGNAWRKKGEYSKAMADYVRALEMAPDFPVTYNNLAWMLATCPDPEYRSGVKALKLAQKALELNPDTSALDTMAAAYAEVGRFDDAVRIMERIITMTKGSDSEVISIYRKHLASYKAKKPWRGK